MTEFITRTCKAESRYEVIIKTDSEEHYKATEDFARRLIDHAKTMTNADSIRAMSDEELARYITCPRQFGAHISCDISCVACCEEWLKQPAEGE